MLRLRPDEGAAVAGIQGYLFSAHAPGFVARQKPGWEAWLRSLPVPAA